MEELTEAQYRTQRFLPTDAAWQCQADEPAGSQCRPVQGEARLQVADLAATLGQLAHLLPPQPPAAQRDAGAGGSSGCSASGPSASAWRRFRWTAPSSGLARTARRLEKERATSHWLTSRRINRRNRMPIPAAEKDPPHLFPGREVGSALPPPSPRLCPSTKCHVALIRPSCPVAYGCPMIGGETEFAVDRRSATGRAGRTECGT